MADRTGCCVLYGTLDGEFLLAVLSMRDVDNECRFLDSTPRIYSSSVTHTHLHQGSAETHRKMNEVNGRWMADSVRPSHTVCIHI